MTMNFSGELENFQQALEDKQERLKALRNQRKEYDGKTKKARQALHELQAILRGEIPSSSKSAVGGIEPVIIPPGNKRPPRGARKNQIKQICQLVGNTGETFRTKAVIDKLREIEGDDEGKVEKSILSYVYSVMNTLGEEGFLQREEGRGKWSLSE